MWEKQELALSNTILRKSLVSLFVLQSRIQKDPENQIHKKTIS